MWLPILPNYRCPCLHQPTSIAIPAVRTATASALRRLSTGVSTGSLPSQRTRAKTDAELLSEDDQRRRHLRRVLYTDRAVVVVDKPAGMVCQLDWSGNGEENSSGHGVGGGFDGLLHSLKAALHMATLPFPVHRLDKPTTGALLLARTLPAARELSRQLQARAVEKQYLALVHVPHGGAPSSVALEPGQSGEVCDSLGVRLDGRVYVAQGGEEEGQVRPARTTWTVVGSSPFAPVSLLRLTLHTGHKHQLRVHLARSLEMPIIGDTVYALTGSESADWHKISVLAGIPRSRLYLHAACVSLSRYTRAPTTRRRLAVAAPLPADFARSCAALGIPVPQGDLVGGVYVNGVPVEEGVIVDGLEGRWRPWK